MPTRPFCRPDTADPYSYYAERVNNSPIEWDRGLGCWTIASYEACRSILNDPAAEIPPFTGEGQRQLNEDAVRLTSHLVRLNNPPHHVMLRQVAHSLLERIGAVPIPELLDGLMGGEGTDRGQPIDWVDRVCMKLPVMCILQGLGLGPGDCAFVLEHIDRLVMLMTPDKNEQQVAAINGVAGDMAALAERAAASMGFDGELRSIALSNLLGLIIQSYDAGRGLLSNALLQVLTHGDPQEEGRDAHYFQRSVIETLRWDPPVHHTRRVAGKDLIAGGQLIRKGQSIIVMLAAANRDPGVFTEPDRYMTGRSNNSEHLTFGAGHHQCLAVQFSTRMASTALAHLFDHGQITLTDADRVYESRWNLRLPKTLWIRLPGLLL